MKLNSDTQTLFDSFEAHLKEFIEKSYSQKTLLAEGIDYALSGQGKRVRPLLCLLVNQALGGDLKKALDPALALEMIHTYSLVHDDMPVLDNDDYRRGRKTVHVVFDEETALLVGNSLLTDAFSLLSSERSELSSEQKLGMIRELSEASGSKGMLHGQMLDVFWTKKNDYTEDDLNEIHLNKTGRLLGASCALGALSVEGVKAETVKSFREIGLLIGQAFQIIDDTLDDSAETGKSSGKDLEQGKLTYLKVLSKEKSLECSKILTVKAFSLLDQLSLSSSEALRDFFSTLLKRTF